MEYNTIGDYEYTRNDWLGSGSFATVYKGRHKDTKQIVAIKEINLKRLGKEHDAVKIMQNLKSEIDTMRILIHPNVLRLEDVVSDGINIYMILEYCDGGDLLSYIRAHKKLQKKNNGLSEAESRMIASQIAEGLRYMHSIGIAHRDLKPQNILLSKCPKNTKNMKGNLKDVVIKIADFGFAKAMETSQVTQTICGSPLYMAPEVLAMKSYTNKADLWSYGTILYELLTGQPPFQANNIIELGEKHKAVQCVKLPQNITVSQECRDLVSALLVTDAEKRVSWEHFLENPWINLSTYQKQIIRCNTTHYSECEIGSAPARIQNMKSKSIPECDSKTIVGIVKPSMSFNSFKVPALDLLKSFEIIDKCLINDDNREFAVVGTEADMIQELQKWDEIAETLYEVGSEKMSLSYYSESNIIFEHCMCVGITILNMIEKYIKQTCKESNPVEQIHQETQESLESLESLNVSKVFKNICNFVIPACVLEFSCRHNKIELLIVRLGKVMKQCEASIEYCNKNMKNVESYKPLEKLLYDTAISFERRGSMEMKIDEFRRAKHHFVSATNLLESLLPYSGETEKIILTKHITLLSKRIQQITKICEEDN